MKRIEFDPDARVELDRAAAHYERDYPGRGLRFYAAIERTVASVAALPNAGHPFPGVPTHLSVRRRVVARFPYVIAYRVLDEVIRIDAVAHTRRRPGYWLDRIDPC